MVPPLTRWACPTSSSSFTTTSCFERFRGDRLQVPTFLNCVKFVLIQNHNNRQNVKIETMRIVKRRSTTSRRWVNRFNERFQAPTTLTSQPSHFFWIWIWLSLDKRKSSSRLQLWRLVRRKRKRRRDIKQEITSRFWGQLNRWKMSLLLEICFGKYNFWCD